MIDGGYLDGPTIQVCSLSEFCREQLVMNRVEDDPKDARPGIFQPYGHCIKRESMGIVRRSVQRIDDPLVE